MGIDEILEGIKKVWKENPELRLGELLVNAIDKSWLYLIDDEQLVRILELYYKIGGQDV